MNDGEASRASLTCVALLPARFAPMLRGLWSAAAHATRADRPHLRFCDPPRSQPPPSDISPGLMNPASPCAVGWLSVVLASSVMLSQMRFKATFMFRRPIAMDCVVAYVSHVRPVSFCCGRHSCCGRSDSASEAVCCHAACCLRFAGVAVALRASLPFSHRIHSSAVARVSLVLTLSMCSAGAGGDHLCGRLQRPVRRVWRRRVERRWRRRKWRRRGQRCAACQLPVLRGGALLVGMFALLVCVCRGMCCCCVLARALRAHHSSAARSAPFVPSLP